MPIKGLKLVLNSVSGEKATQYLRPIYYYKIAAQIIIKVIGAKYIRRIRFVYLNLPKCL